MSNIKATIDRFEGDKGVLVFDDGQNLIVAKSDLGQAKEGAVIYLNLDHDKIATTEKANLAKNILQEILRNNEAT